MSKSVGNIVPLNTGAEDMYGKLMSGPGFRDGYVHASRYAWTPRDIDETLNGVESGKLHPRDVKMKLAREIVSIFYGEDAAQTAELAFIQIFQKKGITNRIGMNSRSSRGLLSSMF